MATLPVAAQAQDAAAQAEVQPQTAPNPYGIPREVVMFEQQDPNFRSATAKVNGAVITGTDVNQRVALVVASSERTELAPEEMQQLRMQVLRNLIDETLQIQAATAQEMPVSKQEVDQRYLGLAQQNFPQDPKQMDLYLESVGSSASAIKRQIEGELAWSNLLRRNVVPFINVSADEVNETIERLKSSRGQYEYRIAEIYLSATPETAEAVQQNAASIMEQIREGGNFQAYARQYSDSTTAAVGGDLDFVRLETLPAEMAEVARDLDVGQIVGPVPIPGGFVIMLLIDKRQVLTADADRGAASVNASVVDNNAMTLRDLPEQLQSVMSQLQVGQATPPFGSLNEGVRVLVLCGRDDNQAATEPDFDQIMDGIEQERINKRAQRYLRDLRNDAIIEYD